MSFLSRTGGNVRGELRIVGQQPCCFSRKCSLGLPREPLRGKRVSLPEKGRSAFSRESSVGRQLRLKPAHGFADGAGHIVASKPVASAFDRDQARRHARSF